MTNNIVSSKHQASLDNTKVSTAYDSFVLSTITVPSAAKTFGIPLERQDLSVCNRLNHIDL
jgi:hypothetical protein